MKNNIDVFEKYSVPKAVFTLATPTMLSMLVTIFYNMADTFFVGQTNDANQVSAVSLATPIFTIIMAVGNIFGIGGSSFISRALGQGNRNKVKNISSFCFYGAIIAGAIMMVLFFCFMNPILTLIGTSEGTIEYAREYLKYLFMGTIFIVLSYAFGNIVRGEGNAKISMAGMMIGTVVNIILDPIMIIALNMGVTGAAIATVIGNICSVIFYIIYFIKGNTILSISPKDFTTKRIVKGVLLIGIPASLNNVLMSLSNIILNRFLYSYGDNAIAGMGVAMKANMLVVMLQLGLGAGIQPLVGYNFGSGNYKRMKNVMNFAMIVNVAIGTILTLIYLLFTENIVEIFIEDESVVAFGVQMLRALMLSGALIGIMFVFSFSFQAMGKAIPSLILSISRQGFVFLPVILIGSKLFGLQGIIYAQPIADLVSLLIALAMFLIISKQMKNDNEIQDKIIQKDLVQKY
ncbi:MAG: MATE family efflux transporter [Ruminococcus sp.]|nr:MATE family efflux transporter [Ruminococcus sp.]